MTILGDRRGKRVFQLKKWDEGRSTPNQGLTMGMRLFLKRNSVEGVFVSFKFPIW